MYGRTEHTYPGDGGVPQNMAPPYGVYPGQPGYVMMPMMNYEQMLNYRLQLAAQQREFMNKRLKENFPLTYVLIHSTCLILIGLACIGLQIAMIIGKSGLYYVGGGIWAGVVCVGLGAFCLLLTKKRENGYFIGSIFMTMFVLMIIFGGLIIVNIISITTFCVFSSECSYYLQSGLHIAMLVLGAIAFVLCIVYFIALPLKLNGFNRRQNLNNPYGNQQQVMYSNNGMPLYPQNISQPNPYMR